MTNDPLRYQPSSVQFSSIPWPIGSSGRHDSRFSRDPLQLPVFSVRSHCEQFWPGQGCPRFDVVHPAFRLPTMASPTLQGTLEDGLGETVVACDVPEPCEFPSLDSCQRRFLWTHKETDIQQRWSSESYDLCPQPQRKVRRRRNK